MSSRWKVTKHPAPQFEQHLLTDSARPEQEEHPADGLDQHDDAQQAHDHQQRVRRAAIDERRDAVVDTALHENRNRQARNVFHHDDDGQERDGPPERPQQRAEQRAGFTPPRQRLVDRQVVVLLVESAPPALGRPPIRVLRDLDGRGVGGGHRPSASVVT